MGMVLLSGAYGHHTAEVRNPYCAAGHGRIGSYGVAFLLHNVSRVEQTVIHRITGKLCDSRMHTILGIQHT